MLSAPALAGGGTGKITAFTTLPNGAMAFTVPHGGNPACGAGTNDFVVDTNTQTGKNTFALLLSAATLGLPVMVFGTNACTVWPDRETVDYIYVAPQ